MISRVLILALSLGTSGCALVEMSGTMTKKTGEVMTEYSKKNEGFIGKAAGVGGRINTSVGTSVENIAQKNKTNDSNTSNTQKFVSANKEVMTAASDAAFNKPRNGTANATKNSFSAFYANFKKFVLKKDRQQIKNMMAPRFEWGLDGYISRDQALKNMDEMKFWTGLRQAVVNTPKACTPATGSCNNRPGFHVWSVSARTEVMFERNANGQWQWTALLGD